MSNRKAAMQDGRFFTGLDSKGFDMRKRKRGMTQGTAQLLADILNIEDALHLRGEREGALLAAALADYRRRLEINSGFVRLQPDHSVEWLRFIEIQRGNGWLKLVDTRIKRPKRKETQLPQ